MSTTPIHEIVQLPFVGQSGREQLLQQCHSIRIDVFVREQGFPLDGEIDEYVYFSFGHQPPRPLPPRSRAPYHLTYFRFRLDERAEHFLLRLLPSLQPIGTVRAVRASSRDVPYYKLGRLAVLKECRQRHFGRELVLALHNWILIDSQSHGEHLAKVVCHSQLAVRAFYAKYA